MSDYQEHQSSSENISAKLQICLFSTQRQLCDLVSKRLSSDRYELKCHYLVKDMVDFVINNYEQIDCLILSLNEELDSMLNQLWQAEVLLPTVILERELLINSDLEEQKASNSITSLSAMEISNIYHEAELRLYPTQLKEVNSYINLAISKFISLSPGAKVTPTSLPLGQDKPEKSQSLISQQRRLTEKLKGRLSYLGFFYKRNPESFWLNLSSEQQKRLLQKISENYRQILLIYFDQDPEINKLIDELVDRAFFANISTAQILEIHMELMDDFSHQLRIEGRNDDILLDYRLPLIDVISHLCEIYRRSIPESDNSVNLLFTVE